MNDTSKRIEAALKMLAARGNALDLEAVKLIKELNQNAQAVGRMGNGLQNEIDLQLRAIEVQSLMAHNRQLMEEIKQLNADLDFVHKERDAALERMDNAVSSRIVDLRQPDPGIDNGIAWIPDDASVRGAFEELAEVSEKLAKALGRPLREEDTPLLLADEVEREMMVLRVAAKVAEKLSETVCTTTTNFDGCLTTIDIGAKADAILDLPPPTIITGSLPTPKRGPTLWDTLREQWQKEEAKRLADRIAGWDAMERILSDDDETPGTP